MSRFERRTVHTPGGRIDIELLVPPRLADVDAAVAPGPLSTAMLERAHAALATWRPGPESDDVARDRLRRARVARRGEDDRTARGERARTASEVVDRMLAAERVAVELAGRDAPPGVTDISRLHAVVLGVAEPRPWRREVLWLGDDTGPDPRMRVQPAAPERVSPALRDLAAFLARDGDPLVQAAIVFAQLPAIHPWRDGNGRVGRVLAQAVLGRATSGHRPPDASSELARRWGDASVLVDAWLADGRLDEWVAGYCGAVVAACAAGAAPSPRRTRYWRRSDR